MHRYLPLSIPAESRRYVEQAVVAGWPAMDFKVRGDLHEMPFNDPKRATSASPRR